MSKNDYRIRVIKMLRSETKRKYKGGRQQIRIQKAPIHMRLGIRHTTKDLKKKAAFIVINIL